MITFAALYLIYLASAWCWILKVIKTEMYAVKLRQQFYENASGIIANSFQDFHKRICATVYAINKMSPTLEKAAESVRKAHQQFYNLTVDPLINQTQGNTDKSTSTLNYSALTEIVSMLTNEKKFHFIQVMEKYGRYDIADFIRINGLPVLISMNPMLYVDYAKGLKTYCHRVSSDISIPHNEIHFTWLGKTIKLDHFKYIPDVYFSRK